MKEKKKKIVTALFLVKQNWPDCLSPSRHLCLVQSRLISPVRQLISFGSIVTGSLEPLPEEQQDIISRFTIAFNQAYIRFLDLQKAEAQGKHS